VWPCESKLPPRSIICLSLQLRKNRRMQKTQTKLQQCSHGRPTPEADPLPAPRHLQLHQQTLQLLPLLLLPLLLQALLLLLLQPQLALQLPWPVPAPGPCPCLWWQAWVLLSVCSCCWCRVLLPQRPPRQQQLLLHSIQPLTSSQTCSGNRATAGGTDRALGMQSKVHGGEECSACHHQLSHNGDVPATQTAGVVCTLPRDLGSNLQGMATCVTGCYRL
jgi:hypothetical protein